MKLDNIFNLKSGIYELFKSKNFELEIKKEYESYLSFGTKLRKFKGLYEYLKLNKFKEILIYGNPHSNYVSTYTFLCKYFNFKVNSIFYTKDRLKKSINSKISEIYSDEFKFIESKNNLEYYIKEYSNREKLFQIPEFGIHQSSIFSLNELWTEIENLKFEFLFLDIGTGFTALTALEYFKEKKIIGVAIGQDEKKIRTYLENISISLNLPKKNLNNLKILTPIISKSFGSVNKELENYIKEFYIKKEIYLDPIYSAKSILTILDYLKKTKLIGKGIYIHQGGILNHLKYFNENSID